MKPLILIRVSLPREKPGRILPRVGHIFEVGAPRRRKVRSRARRNRG